MEGKVMAGVLEIPELERGADRLLVIPDAVAERPQPGVDEGVVAHEYLRAVALRPRARDQLERDVTELLGPREVAHARQHERKARVSHARVILVAVPQRSVDVPVNEQREQ